MDERFLRKLQAAAEHERTVADAAAAAVPLLQAKVDRAQADVANAEESLREAEDEAASAAARADEAEAAFRDAADGVSVTVNAQTAVAEGKAN